MRTKLFFIAALAAIMLNSMQKANAQWSLTGNAGTVPGTNFVGTTDNKALVFKTNGVERGRILPGGGWKFNSTVNALDGYSVNGTPFLNQYSSIYNTFAGFAGSISISGSGLTGVGYASLLANTSGYQNTALGAYSLASNTTGYNNTAVGYTALYKNTTGSYNTANGFSALYSNITGNNNVAIGKLALYSSVDNNYNIAIGDSALFSHNYVVSEFGEGDASVAIGTKALSLEQQGFGNTAVGNLSLTNNNSGGNNTSLGNRSLSTITTGGNNTALGALANVNSSNRYNATAVGYNAVALADNQVMLGNTTVNSVRAAGSFVIYSDGRFKKNIKNEVPGLEFINLLKPITYNYDIHGLNNFINPANKVSSLKTSDEEKAIDAKEKKVYSGFIAQDVEKAAEKLHYDFSGVYKPQNDKDPYGISYADFVVPLVKAVQELSKENDDLKNQLNEIKTLMLQMQPHLPSASNKSANAVTTKSTALLNNIILQQNIPNPFNNSSSVSYYIPSVFHTASLIITDISGKTLKAYSITQSGSGKQIITGNQLTSGMYQYSLIVDGKMIDTKQMILAK